MINKSETKFLAVSDRYLSRQIQRFYDVRAEHSFVDRLKAQKTSEQQIAVYLRENVCKFLLEFAAGVRKTHLTYELDDQGRLTYPGINLTMENLLTEASELPGAGHREQAELWGWQKLQRLLNSGVSQALQLSPPSINNEGHGDYGFLFWFEKQADKRVVNHIFRYNEDKQTLKKSRFLAEQLGISQSGIELAGQNNLPDTLLSNPQGYQDPANTIMDRLSRLGLQFSRQGILLEQRLFQDPLFMMSYVQYQQNLLGYFNESQAQQALVNMYQIALQKAQSLGLADRALGLPVPLIFSGGSCPVIGVGSSTYAYADYLWHSSLPDKAKKTRCPSCSTEWLVGIRHAKHGINCRCGNKVIGGSGAVCIIDAAKEASYLDKQLLSEAETCD